MRRESINVSIGSVRERESEWMHFVGQTGADSIYSFYASLLGRAIEMAAHTKNTAHSLTFIDTSVDTLAHVCKLCHKTVMVRQGA